MSAADPAYFDSRGLVRFRMGDYAGAVADLDAALKLDGKSAGALFVRGVAKEKLGRAAEGKVDIAAALALDPKVAETYAAREVRP